MVELHLGLYNNRVKTNFYKINLFYFNIKASFCLFKTYKMMYLNSVFRGIRHYILGFCQLVSYSVLIFK